jgi:hypothetical protein
MRSALLLIALLAAGCAREDAPAPQPVEVERLLVRLNVAQDQPLPAKARDKIYRAERLVAPLEKVQPDKIDPNLAAALIAG